MYRRSIQLRATPLPQTLLWGVALSLDGRRLYATDFEADHIAVVDTATAYYATDAVERPPVASALEPLANGAFFVAAVVALTRGRDAVRAVVVVGLLLHGGWDLLHVLPVLTPSRHEWLPTACVVIDRALAGAVALVPPPRVAA